MKRTSLSAVTLCLALAPSAPALANRAVQGAAGEITQTDAAALGTVGFRIWSALSGGTTVNINQNTSSCLNVRCIRNYVVNATLSAPRVSGGGGYISNMENTGVYNQDAPDQPFYELIDSNMNDSAGNHILYYGVAGITSSNTATGNIIADGCAGINPVNCFERLDIDNARPPLTGTYVGYGGPPHTIRAIGGLNPVPDVKIDSVSAGMVQLHWMDPPTYTEAMRPSPTAPAPPTPVLGVRLWKNERTGDCNLPTGNDPAWTLIASFNLGDTTAVVPLSPTATCTFYALTVRLIGPAGLPREVETSRVGVNSYPVALCAEGDPCADDFNPCTDDVCHMGMCQHLMIPGPCDDGNACTVNDTCSEGVCVGGSTIDCSDPNPCTTDSCNPSSGCVHMNNTAPCEDGNMCTVGDTCSGGVCMAGGPKDCNDNNVCTNDSCAPATGCAHANNSAACNDNNPCTINDVCAGGACGGTTITPPPEVKHDRLPTKSMLQWDAVPGAVPGTVYDVARGRANELPAGSGGNETCRASGTSQLNLSVPDLPPIGKALWFLVRARNSCGAGTYGSWSNGVPRFTSVCP